ncbi:hypothetical protein [Chromobacterium violaceum]|uniref:Uncharacterized protein n=1 Tax=Chromobacterium violaceum (strain ATCC 12472 / DSM 30191 / JCM 1249 / CCUG 213 / NBRC 12614 / NCIMB 9131 / NCTC 9757 / MK) TaxID=243365 RepID=Q7P0C0_CHRVO|nr:hypothetical protein [Chromobacterium violaceum]AAQ58323.1 hypothetical protein CV_0647 [Chromobacterium violaceum ATCC 12472]MBA8734000.1 hypothetical protein [Chromobacterium violaceum]SUX40095.1 Uncharacterised protein [Chromobacterium violaceum]
MHIQNPHTQETVAFAVAGLTERLAAFEQDLNAWQSLADNAARRVQTAEALRSEAEQARKDCRQAMRSSLGIPTKAVRELKGKEMANLELAEETLKIAEEEKILAEMQQETLFEQRQTLVKERDALRRQYWDAVLDDQIAQWGQQLPVLALLLEQAPKTCIERLFGRAELRRNHEEFFAAQLPGELQQALQTAPQAEPDALLALLSQPLPPLATPASQHHNPIARMRYQAERDEQYQALINR